MRSERPAPGADRPDVLEATRPCFEQRVDEAVQRAQLPPVPPGVTGDLRAEFEGQRRDWVRRYLRSCVTLGDAPEPPPFEFHADECDAGTA